MPYTVREHDRAQVLMIKGRFLGSIERDALTQTFDDLKAAGSVKLVIDLSKTDFMDSTGVGLIVRGAEMLREAGGDVCLAGLQTRVKNLFLMSRLLGTLFQDYPTAEAALQSFAAPPAVDL